MQNLLNERHTATQAVSRNITDDTRFQFDDCNQFKETDAKRLTNQAYSSANFELLQKSPFLTTSSVVGSCKVSDQKDQLDMFSFCQAETPQDTHLYRSIAGKSEHLGNRKAAGLSSAKLQFDTKALKLCDYPENVRQTTDVFDKTNARGASVESKPADMQQHTEAPSILHRHHRVNAFVDNGIYHPSGSTSEVENQRQFDSGIVHYSEPGSEKSGSSMLMNSQVNIGFEEGRNETQQYRFGQRIFTEETAFTESGGCQQAVSRQSSYNSNHLDQPFTVGLANTGETLISLPVCNFDVVVDKDQHKNRFGEMDSRSTGVRRFRSNIERRSFRMNTQDTEEFACQKELLESVNPNDNTGFHSKQQVYLEGAWSGRDDSNSRLKSEVDDIVSVDTTDGLSLSEHERPPADSREFTKSFPIQQSDATAPHAMFNLQADLCVASIAHANNNLNNLEALQSLSQRTFSPNNVILRNEAIPTGLSFNAPGTSMNRATFNRHSGRSRVDYSKASPGRYLCPYCPVKDFRDRRTLQRHIRKHTGEKPFHCNICGRGLGDSRSLFEHVQLHTGNLPYKCKLCGKAFRHHNTFNAHKKKHFT
ncbi:hypothetical protein ACJMK2_025418 [Sinanodonta woodiana]|uniref:C2H2-type domain-containing protein n=1 Tax=Sinanodonta woodiana TaxID=1069815 RepID=A0ABD3XGG1_SINWO